MAELDDRGVESSIESACLAALAQMAFGSIEIANHNVVIYGGAETSASANEIIATLKSKLPAAYHLSYPLIFSRGQNAT